MGNKIHKAARLKYSDIKIGSAFQFEREISGEDVSSFARLTGDFNPLHVDNAFAKKSVFKKEVVHGMLAGSLFSRLVGMHCPGEKSLYISQTLNFKQALFYGDCVTVKGTVIGKNDSVRLVTMKTEIWKSGKVAIDGEAKIKVMNDE